MFHHPKIRNALLFFLVMAITIFFIIGRESSHRQRDTIVEAPIEAPDTYTPNELGVCTGRRWPADVPPLYVITPTYRRAEQIPELTRLAQTLLLVDSLVWIVVDDADEPTPAVVNYLQERRICHVYLIARMPAKFQKLKNPPRGVANRRKALEWLRKHAKKGGAFYFADDDNTYDTRLLDEIRHTKKVSMFPVGLVTQLGLSSPIVRNGKIVGFYDGWIANRKFPVDMAGFAVSVDFLNARPEADMPFLVGQEETKFLESLNFTLDDVELLSSNATTIRVWHTKTKKNNKAILGAKKLNYKDSNINFLQEQIWR
ncbi:galactosylgalactosylxylosylprotein 3-beta-glucuronosyltransferase P isoform X2 [Hyalella azteca]|uniref:Galactosylgalactosylxylosylprotein 3-beta-glucuronosyltransferase n=1 Tax=Hyalella azteca TaxID=294128 RepID=A0A8B7PGR7_HYAAZ|nr:galactosylgalactosylxylosylprotein 3-beta-glucuronosyltransferase P isoform X2 [Hyalella azteca]